MAKRRGARVAPPPRTGEWVLRFQDAGAADGWEDLCRRAPGPTREAWEELTRNPRDRSNPSRQAPLRHALARRVIGGKELEQWQYEVTGAGRIWYCPDDETRTVLLTRATTGHPKETE
jgi:hypothetical protein